LKVAMIIQGYYPKVGGAERQLQALVPHLQDDGFEIRIFTRQYSGLSRYQVVDGIPVHRLPIPGPKVVASLSFTLSAIPALRQFQPDIIHAHELLSPTTTALLAKRLWGTPVLAKVLRGGSLGDIRVLQHKLFGKARFRMQKRHVNCFIVITREIEQELAESGVPARQRIFIPNGVDESHFVPVTPLVQSWLRRELHLEGSPTAVFVGRISPEKRVDMLLNLWPDVRKKHPEANLLILGSGPETESLQAISPPGVQFIGQVEDVSPYLQVSDLFVLPSQSEGLSNALLESMAAGLASIVTDVGGASDVITHSENGWLVKRDDPDSLLEGIITLFDTPQLRKSLGTAARKSVLEEYSLTQTAQRLAALYRTVTRVGNPIYVTN